MQIERLNMLAQAHGLALLATNDVLCSAAERLFQ